MSRTISRETAGDDVEKFFEVIFPVIPKVVRKACVSLGRDPNQMEVDEFTQRIGVLLWKDDYRVLRSFRRESSLETWLFAIAKRNILRWLRETNWMESLEDKPPDSFTVRQRQEEDLLLKERRKILQAASSRLPGGKQKLLGLWLQEMSREQTAEELGFMRESVTVEKVRLVKMLQEIIRKGCSI